MADIKKLNRPTKERMAMLRGLASSLLWEGKLQTTVAKSKSLQSYVEKILTLAKVLNQTLFENTDFKITDSQNLCSLLIQEAESLKISACELEKIFSLLKISCR